MILSFLFTYRSENDVKGLKDCQCDYIITEIWPHLKGTDPWL